jgi:YidC/Oxa1 family membrane protein insertase
MPIVYANIFQPIIDATEAIMKFFHDSVGFSWGFSIIALTIVVRVVLLPLTLKQYHSMQQLQRLQPQIKAIQEKYKEDRQRMNQEMMKFYQENKVNPLGSCLPLLAQMPVFLSLFYMLRKDLKFDICGADGALNQTAKELGKKVTDVTCDQVAAHSAHVPAHVAKFLFIPDLTATAKGGVLITLIVLYIGSQLASGLLMTVSADKSQRRMLIAMPLLFVIFILNFPAGLIVYWITTNVWTIGQQMIVRRLLGHMPNSPKAAQPAAAAALAGGGSASSGAGGAKAKTVAPPPPPRKKKKRSGRRR